jgi:hypothetical protein
LSTSRIEQPRKHTRRQPEGHLAHRADRAPEEAPALEKAVRFAEFKLLLKPDELRHMVDAIPRARQ